MNDRRHTTLSMLLSCPRLQGGPSLPVAITLSNSVSAGTVSGHPLRAGPSSGFRSTPYLPLTQPRHLELPKMCPLLAHGKDSSGGPCPGPGLGVGQEFPASLLTLAWKNGFPSLSVLHSPLWSALSICPHRHSSESSLSRAVDTAVAPVLSLIQSKSSERRATPQGCFSM